MTTRPYELLVRFGANGSISGAHVKTITTVNGREYESDPAPLSGTDDPAFTSFAEQFAAATVAELQQAQADLAAMTADRDTWKGLAGRVPELEAQITLFDEDRNKWSAERTEIRTEAAKIPGLEADRAAARAEYAALSDSKTALDEAHSLLQTAKATLQADLAAAQAEIDRLTALIPPPVNAISKAQGKIILHRVGLLATVEQMVAAADAETQIWWADATIWERENTVLSQLASALGLSAVQVDELFAAAKEIR